MLQMAIGSSRTSPIRVSPHGNAAGLKCGKAFGAVIDIPKTFKLINVPVIKTHAARKFTASLKHFYGILSMADGQQSWRHYQGLGKPAVRWLHLFVPPCCTLLMQYGSLIFFRGYPAEATYRTNQLMASQDPVALDYCLAGSSPYPVDNNQADHRKMPN